MEAMKYSKLINVGQFYGGLSGKTKEDFEDGNAKFITYMNVFSNPSLKTDIEDKVRIKEGEKQNVVKYGDVIFTGSSETPEECGMSSVLEEHTEEPLYLNSFCFGYRFNDIQAVVPAFFKHLFRSNSIRAKIAKTANGVTRFNVSKKLFGEIEIPLPPLPIQQEIVRILDSFASMITNLETELASRQKQYEYYRNELFTFDEADESVEWKTLGEVITCLRTGLNPRVHFKLNTADATGHYVTVRELKGFSIEVDDKTDRINEAAIKRINERSRLQVGDVLFSGTGTIGRTALVKEEPREWNIKEGVYALTPNLKMIISRYMIYSLHTIGVVTQIDNKAGGSTVKSIPMTELKNVIIPVPSLERQQEIVSTLDTFESLISNIKQELDARKKQYEYYREKLLTFE